MNKHNWYSFLVAGLILMLLSISAVACGPQSQVPGTGGDSSSQADAPTVPIPKDYADFEVGPLTVTRSGVSVGEVANISAVVTNTGDVGGTYNAVLVIDGKEADKKDVSVGSKSTEKVSFQVAKNVPGSYKLEIGESAAILNVYEWPYKIQYDSGTASPDLLSVTGDLGHMVHFSPPAVPFKVQKIELYVQTHIVDESDWVDRYVTVRIWDSGRNNQLWSIDVPWRAFFDEKKTFWKEIAVPNVIANGDFYVEVVTHSERSGDEIIPSPWVPEIPPAIFLGYDKPKNPYISAPVSPEETHSSVSRMGEIIEVPVKYQGINWLIRVEGDGRL